MEIFSNLACLLNPRILNKRRSCLEMFYILTVLHLPVSLRSIRQLQFCKYLWNVFTWRLLFLYQHTCLWMFFHNIVPHIFYIFSLTFKKPEIFKWKNDALLTIFSTRCPLWFSFILNSLKHNKFLEKFWTVIQDRFVLDYGHLK